MASDPRLNTDGISILLNPSREAYQRERDAADDMLEILEQINIAAAAKRGKGHLRPSDALKLNNLRNKMHLTSLPPFRTGQLASEALAHVFTAQFSLLEALAPDSEDRNHDLIVALKNSHDDLDTDSIVRDM